MSVYLQFDSSARSQAYIQKDLGAGVVWVPNDNYPNAATPPFNLYEPNTDLVQTPSRYRVFYGEINNTNNTRTIGFLEHCRERPENLTYSVELCTVILPANALVPRLVDGVIQYNSVLEEPYIYVRMVPITHAEANVVYSNNPPADEATFVVWLDKIQVGPGDTYSPPINNPPDRPPPLFPTLGLVDARWVVYKSCMITVMRLDLGAEEWQIRMYDRFGNDILIPESDNGGLGFDEAPPVDPNLQTMVLVGIKPNYPL